MLSVGEKYTIRIEDVNIFGNGVCRVDNVVTFVENGLTDEICEIEIISVNKSYAYAKAIKIIEESPHRVKPICKHFRKCGGCSFLHTTIEQENKIKENYVKKAFQKAGIFINVEDICSPTEREYRNKIALFYDGCGFGYNRVNTNNIVTHERCMLNCELFDKITNESANLLKNSSVRALSLRKTTENEITACLVFENKYDLTNYIKNITSMFPQIKNIFYSLCKDEAVVFEKQQYILAYGEGYIYDKICGLDFRISPESFYQINHLCAEKLYEKVVSLASLNKDSKCADLFCGTGTIGIICAKRTGAEVYGVEIIEKAIDDANYNASLNNVKNVHFKAQDASKFKENVDVAIIDPPRKGLSKMMLDTLLRLKPSKIVYVSCNVDTQVRDIKMLSSEYEISSPVSIFNMFPKTSHVESLVCLMKQTN